MGQKRELPELPLYLTMTNASRLVGISQGTLRKWMKIGILKRHALPNGIKRIRTSELLALFEEEGRGGA